MLLKASFQKANAQIIKSIKQRQLLQHWAMRAKQSVPEWTAVDFADFPSQREDLIVYAVTRSGPNIRYKIVKHGPVITKMYGTDDVGKFLDDALPANVAAPILFIYDHCVRVRKPVYTVTPVKDASGRPVTYERLLLPFRVDDNEIDVIMGSLEVVSTEGRFDMMRLMSAQPSLGPNTIQATIE